MARVVKGRMEAIKAGSPGFPRYIIEDHQDRDDPSYYVGPDRRWTGERGRAGLFHDRESAEEEIEGMARRDVMLAPGLRYTLEIPVTTYGDADRFEVELYLREALEIGLRRHPYRKGRTLVDSLVVIDAGSARLRLENEAAHEGQADRGAS